MPPSELLDISDPLLAHVRRAAPRNEDAFAWLMQSAKRWARREFLHRTPPLEDDIAARLYDWELREVAVLVEETNAVGHSHEVFHTFVGLLEEGCSTEYLAIKLTRDEVIRGVFKIADILLLPEEFVVEPWPFPAVHSDEKNVTERELKESQLTRAGGDYVRAHIGVADYAGLPVTTDVSLGRNEVVVIADLPSEVVDRTLSDDSALRNLRNAYAGLTRH